MSFKAGTQKKLRSFCSLIESFHGRSGQLSAYDITYAIVRESGIAADFLGEKTAENISRQENVDEFLGSIKSYEKEMAEAGEPKVLLADFLSTVALLTDSDQKSDETPRVTLMTVHASKGLEFNTVFVTGLEEDLFPNANARLYPREMEEERRLFYVAVTRAKEHCFLSYSSTRFKWGNLECSEPSSFIDEIDEQYIESEAETAHPEIFSKARSKSWGSASSSFGTYSGGRLGRARGKRMIPGIPIGNGIAVSEVPGETTMRAIRCAVMNCKVSDQGMTAAATMSPFVRRVGSFHLQFPWG